MGFKKACVCGHFAFGKNLFNGQTIKTKVITAELERHFGLEEVYKIDTYGGVRVLFRLILKLLKAVMICKNIVIFPAQNGVQVFVPLLNFINLFFRRKLHYVVIGGWLPEFIKNKKNLAKQLKKLGGIYVETNTMKKALEKQGFINIRVMPNCKELTPLALSELVFADGEPYKLCTFSRVMKEKGIEDAVEAVKTVNERLGRTVYELDIYGQVDSGQTDWFDNLRKNFPQYIRYGGVVPFDKSVETLKNYFALLFPTRFYTEGIPGTIIDAYAAGIPVISSKWENFLDIVDNNVTGIGYEFGNVQDLIEILIKIGKYPEDINALKGNCIQKSRLFIPGKALKVLINELA